MGGMIVRKAPQISLKAEKTHTLPSANLISLELRAHMAIVRRNQGAGKGGGRLKIENLLAVSPVRRHYPAGPGDLGQGQSRRKAAASEGLQNAD